MDVKNTKPLESKDAKSILALQHDDLLPGNVRPLNEQEPRQSLGYYSPYPPAPPHPHHGSFNYPYYPSRPYPYPTVTYMPHVHPPNQPHYHYPMAPHYSQPTHYPPYPPPHHYSSPHQYGYPFYTSMESGLTREYYSSAQPPSGSYPYPNIYPPSATEYTTDPRPPPLKISEKHVLVHDKRQVVSSQHPDSIESQCSKETLDSPSSNINTKFNTFEESHSPNRTRHDIRLVNLIASNNSESAN